MSLVSDLVKRYSGLHAIVRYINLAGLQLSAYVNVRDTSNSQTTQESVARDSE